jgi:hypothetical protein
MMVLVLRAVADLKKPCVEPIKDPMPRPTAASSSPRAAEKVLGHDIPKVRPTLAGVMWCLLYLGLPVALIGNLLDLMAQILLGWCIGFWCVI